MPGSRQDPTGSTERIAADDVPAQHGRIVAHLRLNGRTSCPELAAACDVPSVTKRICELIAAGWPIVRSRGRVRTKRGAWRRTTLYELTGQHPQGELFGDA